MRVWKDVNSVHANVHVYVEWVCVCVHACAQSCVCHRFE